MFLSLSCADLALSLSPPSGSWCAVGDDATSSNALLCETCPYSYVVRQPLIKSVRLARREADDVLGGDEAWENVQKADVTCPRCGNGQAYFMEVQTRSADEPATLFFRCTSCKVQWRE